MEWIRCLDSDGYPRAGFVGDSGESSSGKSSRVNRIIYELAYNADILGLVVRHKCDNRKCLNPNHLELGTSTDNMRDRDSRERHGCSKLSHNNVRDIRIMYSSGKYKQRELAEIFNVSPKTISGITTYSHFKHVKSNILEV